MSEQAHIAPTLKLDGISAGYRSDRGAVIDQMNLSVEAGTLTRVAGQNGSGKSTLLEVISGYLRPWSGKVLVAGHEAHTESARLLRRVCRTAPALYPSMTAVEHLEFASRCAGRPLEESLARAERYGLTKWIHHEAKELSTGNVRKLWLLMCTLGDFDLVVLDEPVNGLDVNASAMLWEEVQQWRRTKAVVLIAHNLPNEVLPDSSVHLGGSSQLRV